MPQFPGVQLGLDVGALAIKACFADGDGHIRREYRLHKGEPEEAILAILQECGNPGRAAITGSGGRQFAELLGIPYVDPAVALVAAAKEFAGARHIVDIGGGSLSIVDLDEQGRFAGFRTNSLCAAGTGSFLDEQAGRMRLTLEEMAKERSIAEPPRIAARCAVFAKSDLIHRQQEGYSIPEMWSGLCRGMVHTALTTLFRGKKPNGMVVVAGGVAQNREVLRWLRDELQVELAVPEYPAVFSAEGALRAVRDVPAGTDWSAIGQRSSGDDVPRRRRLELLQSQHPDFSCAESFLDDGTEVRLHRELCGEVVIGIDIGSTSTKAAVLDLKGKVIADFYRRTAGDPIGAAQRLLSSIGRASRGAELTVRGTGTTGSGRKMVGAILGADRIVNEITAHVRGAIADTPDVETIFEIGGQDAKFIAIREGVPHDSNMNYVCAAGTGSFVEEQAGKLGFALTEIGDAVMGTEPPFSSDRCTVFMEQDVHALIRQGFDRREVMGSVLCSVVQNYLNRVVGRRPYSRKKICFMGATARNRGLVAAFEQLTGAAVVVSPFCHVMGAFGVARVVLEEVVGAKQPTAFKGLSIASARVELDRGECRLCANRCRITTALVEGADPKAAPSWGYMCGRDPSDASVRVSTGFSPFRKRRQLWGRNPVKLPAEAPTIGLPQALLNHTYLPLWRRFFAELGIRTVLSKPTSDETLLAAVEWISSDYCYPVKLAHGHLRHLAADPEVKQIFLPYLVQGEAHDDRFTRSVFCPYNIALPSIAQTAGIAEPEEKPILRPVINLQWPLERIAKSLYGELRKTFGVTRPAIAMAWKAAIGEQRRHSEEVEAIGIAQLRQLEASGGRGIVILGRPYNVYDTGANLSLPQKIADLGITVLSVDMLPLKEVEVDPLFHNMYWRYGRKILQAAHFVARHPNLHAVFLTNFGCGPDSFLQTYVEHIMRGKPMLLLELDEHSADAGYITRLEAFRDVITAKEDGSRKPEARSMIREDGKTDAVPIVRHPSTLGHHEPQHTLWIPPMHPYGAPMLAAALRGVGTHARPLPPETPESFAMAKAFCRGTECVPAPATIGAFLKVLSEASDPSHHSLFMPSAKGPCRFGQYHTLHRMILDEAGYRHTRVEAWSDESGTYGTGLKTSQRLFNAILAGDLLYKARCRVRPYAEDVAAFDTLMEDELHRAIYAAEHGWDLQGPLRETARRLQGVTRVAAKKPLVGIVGEIYVRLNPFTNGRLVETIEESGGEAWVAPVTEWFHYLAFMDSFFAKDLGEGWVARSKKALKNLFMMRLQRRLIEGLMPVIGDRLEPSIGSTLDAGRRYFPLHFDGESILTVGRAVEFAHQGAKLVINCAPFGCMPGTLTAGVFRQIEGELGIPIVSLFFDGESDLKHLVRTYLVGVGAQPL